MRGVHIPITENEVWRRCEWGDGMPKWSVYLCPWYIEIMTDIPICSLCQVEEPMSPHNFQVFTAARHDALCDFVAIVYLDSFADRNSLPQSLLEVKSLLHRVHRTNMGESRGDAAGRAASTKVFRNIIHTDPTARSIFSAPAGHRYWRNWIGVAYS